MIRSSAGISNVHKFFISLSIIFIVVILDYRLFLDKYRKVEFYDDLNYKVSSVRVSIAKLEYLLDMYLVARRFEKTTIDIIKEDVRSIDESISSISKNAGYKELLGSNTPLSESMRSISGDWETIKIEIKRLNSAMSQDEVMLIHNAVDMNTILVTEKAERLLGLIGQSRRLVFAEIKGLALKTTVGFVLFMLFGGLIYFRKVISPISRASVTARRVAAGDLFMRFKESPRSVTGRLANDLNSMLDSLSFSQIEKERENKALSGTLEARAAQFASMISLMSFAGSSLSQNELYAAVVKEVASNGAGCAAVYILENGEFRLKASSGCDHPLTREASSIPAGALSGRDSSETVVYAERDPHPNHALWKAFQAAGFAELVSVPMPYNGEVRGFVYAAFREQGSQDARLFIEAAAIAISACAGHASLFHKETLSRKFLERVMNQMPFGVAVLERDGKAVFMNTHLKRFIGAGQNDTPVYSLFDDAALSVNGHIASLKRSYEGYMAEVTVDYDPILNASRNFAGPARRLKLTSLPVYDSGGEISNIMVLAEDTAGAKTSTGETLK